MGGNMTQFVINIMFGPQIGSQEVGKKLYTDEDYMDFDTDQWIVDHS